MPFFLVFFSISAHSQLNKFARNNFWFSTKPTAATPEPNDTLDVSVCMGDTLVARPSLPEGMDITWNYEYTWKKFSAGNVNGTNLGSSNKKVDDMALTVEQDTTFYVTTQDVVSGYLYCISNPTKVDITIINPVFVPNAFTPNNDGLNDMFKVEGAYILSGARLSIYNSWGELVLQTNNVDRGWDGTINGKPQPAGVYVYILDATLRSTGKLYKKHGPIALLR